MEILGKRTVRLGMTVGLSLGAIVGVVGCNEVSDDADGAHEFAVVDDNGLMGINGLTGVNGLYGTNGINGTNGLSATNGLTGVNGLMGTNGLSATNGISGVNGLSATNGLMTTDAGRKTVAYLVKCALSSGDSMTKQDQTGVTYTFNGGLGLCPEWKTGSVHRTSTQTEMNASRTCQNLVSACLMAHINTSGVHVPLWLDSENLKIGWGVSTNYPKQEGTFFGNIIETGSLQAINMTGVYGPKAYFCEGAGITAGVVAGRLGYSSGAPYTNPYGANVKCSSGQTTPGPISYGMTAPDGYKQACANGYCFQQGEPITVWRNPDYVPVFDQAYRYDLEPQVATSERMEVPLDSSGRVVAGTKVKRATKTGGDAQKFTILKDGSNWKIAPKKDTSKCLFPTGRLRLAGTELEVQNCDSSVDEQWEIKADANTGAFRMKHVGSGLANLCLDADSSPLLIKLCSLTSNGQKFKMGSSY